MSGRRGILSAAILIVLGGFASRVLGLGRDEVIALYFGASAVTSAFQTASRVPTIFYDLVVGGAVSAALIPVLSSYADDPDPTALGEIVSTLLTGSLLLLVGLVALLSLAAPLLTRVLGVPVEQFGMTLDYIRLTIPALLFLGLNGVVGAVSYARRKTVYPALSIALFNLGLIASAVLLHARLGGASLALGVLAGGALQFLAVLPGLRGIPLRPRLSLGNPAVRRMVKLYAPVAAGLVITEASILIDANLAWRTGVNSLSYMRYATNFVQLPLGLVATATSLGSLPLLSRLVDDPIEFRKILGLGLRLALLAIFPALVFLVVFAEPTTRLVYQRGAFDASATSHTVQAFLLYAPQLPFVAVDQLLVYAYYARRDTVTPMLVGVVGVGIYLVSALTMIGPLGLGLSGLILANTLQNSLHAVILVVLLSRAIGSLASDGVGSAAARAIAAAGGGALLATAIRFGVPPPGSTLGLALYLLVGASSVLGAYLVLLHVLGVDEVTSVPRLVATRLTRGKTAVEVA